MFIVKQNSTTYIKCTQAYYMNWAIVNTVIIIINVEF